MKKTIYNEEKAKRNPTFDEDVVKMVDKISIVVAKNEDGYSVNFPELDAIDYQDSSLDEVLNRLKDIN